jgi:hypothetical protein
MRIIAAGLLGLFFGGLIQMARSDEAWLHRSREPLLDRRGNVAFEGRRIILPSDAFPREAARLIDGPTVRRDGDAVRNRV